MFFFLGAVAGIVYGLTAIGGGLLIVPLLMLGAGLDADSAITMTLCILVVLTTITAGDGVRARLPRPGEIWPAALACMLTAGITIFVVYSCDLPLEPGLRGLLVLAGLAMLFFPLLFKVEVLWPRAGLAEIRSLADMQLGRLHPLKTLAFVVTGSLAGVITGLVGAGGSVAMLPGMGRYNRQERGQATACSEMALLPGLVVAVILCLALDRDANWLDTGLAIFGALAGISLARMLALRMPLLIWQAMAGIAALVCAFII